VGAGAEEDRKNKRVKREEEVSVRVNPLKCYFLLILRPEGERRWKQRVEIEFLGHLLTLFP